MDHLTLKELEEVMDLMGPLDPPGEETHLNKFRRAVLELIALRKAAIPFASWHPDHIPAHTRPELIQALKKALGVKMEGWLMTCVYGEETFGFVKDGPPDKYCSVCGTELKGPAKLIEIPEITRETPEEP